MTEHISTNRRQFIKWLASLTLALLLGLTALNATSEAKTSSRATTATITVRNRCGERCLITVQDQRKWVNNGASQTFRVTSTFGSFIILANKANGAGFSKGVPIRDATYTVKTGRYGILFIE